MCKIEAKKYNTKKELLEKSPSAYCAMRRNGWVNDMCSHMDELVKHKWELDEAIREGKRFKTVKDFSKSMSGLYQVVIKNGWQNEVMSHMKRGRDKKYSIESVIEEVKKHYSFREMGKSNDKYTRGCYWWILKNKKSSELINFLKNG